MTSSNRVETVQINVSSDTSNIGPDAHPQDLEQFATNLAAEISQRFGVDCYHSIRSQARSTSCDVAEIDSWLREIAQSDAWTSYL